MADAIGLYFPYLHFRDRAWLRTAALYWDQLFRIVPEPLRGQTNDSDDVTYLKQELDFIHDFDPWHEAELVAPTLATWLEQDPKRAATLRVDERHVIQVPSRHRIRDTADPQWDSSLAYVHVRKLDPRLRDYLVREHLGVLRGAWLGMHPRLGDVYMTALAREIATRNDMHPLSIHEQHQFAVLEPTMDTLASDLLDTPRRRHAPRMTIDQLATRYVEVMLPVIVPKNLATISIKKVVATRRALTPAFRAFQNAVAAAATEARVAEINSIPNEDVRDVRIRNVARKEFIEPYEELKTCLGELGSETTERLLVIGVQLAAVVKTGGLALATTALGLIPGVRAGQEKHRAELRASPSAYLLRLDEEFRPAGRLTRFKRVLRRATHGI